MRTRLAAFVAGAGAVGLLVLEFALGPVAAETAARFPEAAHLSAPVLVLALVFCAAGQLALLALTLAPRRRGRLVAAGSLLVMAGAVIAIEALTMIPNITPPLLGLVGWPTALALIAASLVLLLRTRRAQEPERMPAARAGTA